MFDLKWIRDNQEAFDAAMAKRGLEPKAEAVLALDEDRRKNVSQLQEFQTQRNTASKGIGKAKGAGDEETAQKLMNEVADLKKAIAEGEEAERKLSADLKAFLSELPNLPHEDVPAGEDENDNQLVRENGDAPKFSFEPKQHFEIGEELGLMDFETAAKLSGARFVVLKGALAKLERALAAFMVDVHTNEFGYTEMLPPFLVNDESMYGTAQLPKFADDQYRTENGFWLVPTAEVPLTNLVREQIVSENDLPFRFTAYTPCFRMEAGAAGRDTRGMIRQHQFSKVELVSVVHPDNAMEEHERMTGCAEAILQKLGLAYRVMLLCTGDMGFGARKTYDLEVWLPGQDTYREISSCSVCGDFQARRMNARFRPNEGKELNFVHTLNGSGLAIGRTMVAVLENYQQEDGSVVIPEVLRPYMGGLEIIKKG